MVKEANLTPFCGRILFLLLRDNLNRVTVFHPNVGKKV